MLGGPCGHGPDPCVAKGWEFDHEAGDSTRAHGHLSSISGTGRGSILFVPGFRAHVPGLMAAISVHVVFRVAILESRAGRAIISSILPPVSERARPRPRPPGST